VLLHVPEGTESAPVLQRLPGMHHRPFRGILGAALLLAGLGPDSFFREKALMEERQAKRRMAAEAFAAGGAHTVGECEALLRDVGDDQGLAETAIWIARNANVDLQQAALLARDGGQELVNLKRATELRDLSLFNREPAKFDDIPTFRGVPLARRMPDGSLSTTRPTISPTGTASTLRAAGLPVPSDIPDDTWLTVRSPAPRGPGLQIRDARTRAGTSLRDLAAHLEIHVVEMGEIERNIRPVTADLWAKARAVLPALPEVMPPETAQPRAERQVLVVDASLHPAGRCTCGAGGGDAGTCEWCVMDRRRSLREVRRPSSIPCTCTPDSTCQRCYMLGYNDANPEERIAERARKREVRRAKQARKARRGW